MKKIYNVVILLSAVLLLNACGLGFVRGSGHVISENRAVNGFDKVTLSGIGEVILTQGTTESLSIEAEDNLVPYFETTVRSGTLEIGIKSGMVVSVQPTRPVVFHLTMKDVRGLNLSGSGSINVPGAVKTDQLELKISGSGAINLNSVTAGVLATTITGSGSVNVSALAAKTLASTITGSGKVTLAGHVMEQLLVVNGSGKYEASNLDSQTMAITVRGSGNSVIKAALALDVNISGSGDVRYYGNPKVNTSISGSGKVQHVGE